MSNLREVAYRMDLALWVHHILGAEPTKWHEDFLRAPRGASILALTARQQQNHHRCLGNGACSFVSGRFAQRGRLPCAAVRRVREALIKAGDKLEAENVL